MKISLSNSGKRYNREWIFRNATIEFHSGNAYAITGPNGSGKSTLLQCIGGMLHLSEGKISYERDGTVLPEEKWYGTVSFCAPYMELIEELTLAELLQFHHNFKPFLPGMDTKSIIEAIGLENAADKQLRWFSSGMKQRVKIALALLSLTEVVLLDEPCTNLDASGIALYHELTARYCNSRIVLISSNDVTEYSFASEQIPVTRFKTSIPGLSVPA